jgi:hypothetical protein
MTFLERRRQSRIQFRSEHPYWSGTSGFSTNSAFSSKGSQYTKRGSFEAPTPPTPYSIPVRGSSYFPQSKDHPLLRDQDSSTSPHQASAELASPTPNDNRTTTTSSGLLIDFDVKGSSLADTLGEKILSKSPVQVESVAGSIKSHEFPARPAEASSDLELVRDLHSSADSDLPIPTLSETSDPRPSSIFTLPVDNRLILTGESSVYKYGGFCKGALMMQDNQANAFRPFKRPVGITNVVATGRCSHCMYEARWGYILRDNDGHESGILREGSIRYRQRFLLKSHVATHKVDEAIYACIFCVADGRMVDPSDATVFFSHRKLLAHAQKHGSRPRSDSLNSMIRVAVGETSDLTFDIHFPDTKRQSTATDEISLLRSSNTASAMALTSCRKGKHGNKGVDPLGRQTLEFARGARITKIVGNWPQQSLIIPPLSGAPFFFFLMTMFKASKMAMDV